MEVIGMLQFLTCNQSLETQWTMLLTRASEAHNTGCLKIKGGKRLK